jgi:putative sporulation protein YtaF
MFLTCFLLAISVSIDSFGIGIAYGLKNTKIANSSKILLFIISIIITLFSIKLGNYINKFFPIIISKIIGIFILIFIGLWIIFEASNKCKTKKLKKKSYNIFLKPFGITINIIKNPIESDLDNSNYIDIKESIYLGFALSLDALCVGIGSSIIGINLWLFPIMVATFQLIFISLGNFFSKKLLNKFNMPENIWSIISGILLIFIGILKIFF